MVVAKTISLPTTAYPSVLGDMLSSGIASIGFSWVSILCESKLNEFSHKQELGYQRNI